MRIFLAVATCLALGQAYGQKATPVEVGRAITMDGRRIILYDNGTFRYEVAEQKWTRGTGVSTDTVQQLFASPIAADAIKSSPYNSKEWHSTRTHFAVGYNPKKWKLRLTTKGAVEEASFHLADTYAWVFTERIDSDYESMIQNLKLYYKQLDPASKLVKEEWRNVNNLTLYHMVWDLNIDRVRFRLYGYYGRSNGASVQLVVHTPQAVVADTEPEIYRLLSGLRIASE